MALKKANAEIIRQNLRTNKVTVRKKDGNFFYAKEKGEILESNPRVSELIFILIFYAYRQQNKLTITDYAINSWLNR